MPNYEYKCVSCNKKFTLILTVKEYEKRKVKCIKCNSTKVKPMIGTFYAKTSKKS